jgi:hypothetical protein
LGLPAPKISVQPTLTYEVIVATLLLYNVAVIKNKNLVGMANRAKAMSQNQKRCIGGGLLERGKDACFTKTIQHTGGFIQDQKLRMAQQSSSQGDALTLPTA